MWAIAGIPSIMRNNVQLLFGKPTSGTEAMAHRRGHSKIPEHGQQSGTPKGLVCSRVLLSLGCSSMEEFLRSIFKSWVGFPVAQRPKASHAGTDLGYPCDRNRNE